MIVDPPDDFAPLADWRAFRGRMERLRRQHPDDEQVAQGLAIAEARIAELEAAQ